MTYQYDGLPSSGSHPDRRRLITVIVPTYNDPRLPLCLASLREMETPPHSRVEIIVVDNGSDEPSRGLVEGSGARFLVELRRGSYAARNTGLEVARGEIVAFTDSDCQVARDWLVAAVAHLDEDPGLAAVAGRVRTVFDTGRPSSPAGWYESVHAFPQESYVKQGFGVTANLVVRRTAGDAVGWFDSAALSGGDLDFGRRLTRSGGRLAYAADAVVAHPARATWAELFAKGRRTAQGQGRLDAVQGAKLRHFAKSTVWFGVELFRVFHHGFTHRDLPDASARAQYIAAGVSYRVLWYVQRIRWRLHYARELAQATPPTEERVGAS